MSVSGKSRANLSREPQWVADQDQATASICERRKGATMDERYAANPDIPETPFIVTGTTLTGEPVTVALGVCVCHENRGPGFGKFWLRPGEQWVCPECDRTYLFDGHRIDIAEPDHI